MSKAALALSTRVLALICTLVMASTVANAQTKGPVLVIGAGVSGLKAAVDLATKGYAVTVLEARDRIGGRVHTVDSGVGPIEMGAQWIHGTSNPIL
jgi:polyamine oxidase